MSDDLKETIRDLLRLAADPSAGEMEAENALRRAQRLMERHDLGHADLETYEQPQESNGASRQSAPPLSIEESWVYRLHVVKPGDDPDLVFVIFCPSEETGRSDMAFRVSSYEELGWGTEMSDDQTHEPFLEDLFARRPLSYGYVAYAILDGIEIRMAHFSPEETNSEASYLLQWHGELEDLGLGGVKDLEIVWPKGQGAHAAEPSAEPGEFSDCPNGHGKLRLWRGRWRCWLCGWPNDEPEAKVEAHTDHLWTKSGGHAFAYTMLGVACGIFYLILLAIRSFFS